MPKIKEVAILNIPSKVKIGGLNYNVKEVPNLNRDREHQGESCGNNLEITIDNSLSTQVKETTFVHELLEQINEVYMIGLEHKQIYDLEAGIYAFIKDNPSVFNEKPAQNNIGVDVKINNDTLTDDLVDKATNKFAKQLRNTLQEMKR